MKQRTCRLSAEPDAERRKTKRSAMYCSTPQTSRDDVYPKTDSKRIPHLPPVWQEGGHVPPQKKLGAPCAKRMRYFYERPNKQDD